MENSSLELALIYLLNMKAPNGKTWVSITTPGIGRFTREDVERELARLRRAPWWKFWKR